VTDPTLRRVLHVGSGALLFAIPLGSWSLLRGALAALVFVALIIDAARITSPRFGSRVANLVPVFRAHESSRLSGATWLSMGYLLAAAFPEPAPVAGILVSALADPAASLAGGWGRKSAEKTLRGSLTALVVATGILTALQLPLLAVLGGACTGAVLERWSGHFDDNLVVAPGVTLIVWLMA